MNAAYHPGKIQMAWFLCLAVILHASPATAALPENQPVITALSLVGTNLVFDTEFPAGVEQAVLEMRPNLTADWQEAALLDVPTNGGNVEFSIPQPPLDMAFFRLNATLLKPSQTKLSDELRYVTVPSLVQATTNNKAPAEAVFHFKGQIDGSDRIVITHQGAFWEHVNWAWPADAVTVNDSQWNPLEKNFMTTTGAVAFLPQMYSLATANLEIIEGRDVIALERTNEALMVYLDDTQSGSAPYEFNIHFHMATMAASPRPATAATLKIAAQIDGSDRLKITAGGAAWTHLTWSLPEAVTLNGVSWDLRQTNVLRNTGTNTFLPAGVDFSTARIVHRRGRDLATLWADNDAVWVTFADNPNGSDAYELEISFGQ
jgi:hypothetical protein